MYISFSSSWFVFSLLSSTREITMVAFLFIPSLLFFEEPFMGLNSEYSKLGFNC